MKHLIFALILAGSIAPFTARADILLEDHHPVEACIRIDNLAEFSDYIFFVNGEYKFPYTERLYEEGICGLRGTGTLLAVERSNYDKLDMSTDPQDPESAGDWPNREVNWPYLNNTSLTIPFTHQVPDVDPTAREMYTVHIERVSDDGIDASFSQLTRWDDQGNVITAQAKNNTTAQKALNIVGIALGIVGIAGLIATAKNKKWKK